MRWHRARSMFFALSLMTRQTMHRIRSCIHRSKANLSMRCGTESCIYFLDHDPWPPIIIATRVMALCPRPSTLQNIFLSFSNRLDSFRGMQCPSRSIDWHFVVTNSLGIYIHIHWPTLFVGIYRVHESFNLSYPYLFPTVLQCFVTFDTKAAMSK